MSVVSGLELSILCYQKNIAHRHIPNNNTQYLYSALSLKQSKRCNVSIYCQIHFALPLKTTYTGLKRVVVMIILIANTSSEEAFASEFLENLEEMFILSISGRDI